MSRYKSRCQSISVIAVAILLEGEFSPYGRIRVIIIC